MVRKSSYIAGPFESKLPSWIAEEWYHKYEHDVLFT